MFLKEPAEGGGGKVYLLCDRIYIGLAPVIGLDILIDAIHPLFGFLKRFIQRRPVIQEYYFVRRGQ